jgi:hypothetical protein
MDKALPIYMNVQSVCYTVKMVGDFPVPAGMSRIKLCLAGNKLIIPGQRVWFVTSRLGTGKLITFFTGYYTVLSALLKINVFIRGAFPLEQI